MRRVRALVATEDTAGLHLDFDADRPAPPPASASGMSAWCHGVTRNRARRAAPPGSSTPKAIPSPRDIAGATRPRRERSSPMRHRMPPRSGWRDAGLYGGMFLPAFGHFLSETTSRFWAADRAGDLDGVRVSSRNPARAQRAASFPPPAAVPRRPRAGPSAGAGSAIRGRDRGTGPPEQGAGAGALAAGLPD